MSSGEPPFPEEGTIGGTDDESGHVGPPAGAPGADASAQSDPPDGRRKVNDIWVLGLGTMILLAFGVALIASLVNLWPSIEAFTGPATTTTTKSGSIATSTTSTGATHTVRLLFGLVPVKAKSGTALVLLVVILGALGGVIHMFTSFADFVGNRRFYDSWIPWYALRPIIGAALALLTYFALRGGFFSGSLQSGDVNPYGIAALSGLAGLFSKQATDKLREVFETLFRVSSQGGDAQRKDDLANAAPVIKKVEPEFVAIGAQDVDVKVTGEHFVQSTVVHIDGDAQTTKFVNPQLLEVTLLKELREKAAVLKVTAVTGPPGGGESQPVSLAVHP